MSRRIYDMSPPSDEYDRLRRQWQGWTKPDSQAERIQELVRDLNWHKERVRELEERLRRLGVSGA